MPFFALATFILAIAAIFVYFQLPPLRKDPYADQPNTFKVWLVKPPRDLPGGCLLVLDLFVLTIGFVTQNQTIIWCAGIITVPCLVLGAVFLVKDSIQAKVEAKSLSRIELTSNSICIYDREGQLVHHAIFADIVDLPMYQGYDAQGKHFVDRILVTSSGEEIVLPPHGIDGRQLKRRIQEATKMKFSFRNNSTRHQ